MLRFLSPLLVVTLLSGPARAEPFTVWEEAGWIWGRNEATGSQWVLSGMATGRDPQVAGYFAAWLDSRLNNWGSGIDAIYLYIFEHRWGPFSEDRVWYTSHFPLSDLAVSVVSTEYAGQYWVAWREQGGVWAQYLNRRTPSPIYEPLPNYGGQFSLQVDQLLYDGGQLTLIAPIHIPEPDVFVMLCGAALCLCLGHRLFFRR